MPPKKNSKKQQQQKQQQQQPKQGQQLNGNDNEHDQNQDHHQGHHDHNHQHGAACSHNLPKAAPINDDNLQDEYDRLPPPSLSEITKSISDLSAAVKSMEQMPQPTSLVDSLNMIPKLTEMLNSLSGFGLQQVKPDDPLPDFTKFDKAKETLEIQIQDFHTTLQQVKTGDLSMYQRPPKNPTKLTKEQQEIREKNNRISRQNIEYLDGLQKELKQLQKEPLLADIQGVIEQAIKNLQADAQHYQKSTEL